MWDYELCLDRTRRNGVSPKVGRFQGFHHQDACQDLSTILEYHGLGHCCCSHIWTAIRLAESAVLALFLIIEEFEKDVIRSSNSCGPLYLSKSLLMKDVNKRTQPLNWLGKA